MNKEELRQYSAKLLGEKEKLQQRIDKAIKNIQKINNKKIIDLNWELEELLCILKGE